MKIRKKRIPEPGLTVLENRSASFSVQVQTRTYLQFPAPPQNPIRPIVLNKALKIESQICGRKTSVQTSSNERENSFCLSLLSTYKARKMQRIRWHTSKEFMHSEFCNNSLS